MKLYTGYGQNAQTDLIDLLLGKSLTDYPVVVVTSPKGLPIALRDSEAIDFPEIYNPVNGNRYVVSLEEKRVAMIGTYEILTEEGLIDRIAIERRLQGKNEKPNYYLLKADTEDIGGVLEELLQRGFELIYPTDELSLTEQQKAKIFREVRRKEARKKAMN